VQITCHVNWPGPNDPFYLANPTENMARKDYYAVSAVPQVQVDGFIDGGSGSLETLMLNRRTVDSPLTIAVSGQILSPTTGEITATITNTSGASVGGALHFVLTETDVPYSGKNWTFVMRDFFPGDTAGEAITLGPGDTLVRTAAFNVGGAWVRRNMAAIVFVQNDLTKEVLQAGRIYLDPTQPELVMTGIVIDDAAGDGDGRLDPGETVNLSYGLGNLNPATATGVAGMLSTTDPLTPISDASGTWPDIPTLEMRDNTADPFVVSSAANSPWGRIVSATLAVNAGPDGFGKSYTVTIPVGSPNDPIGADGYGYYAYEDCDDSAPSPVYSWTEVSPLLGGTGTLVNVGDDATTSMDMPFPFKYYGTVFTRISICSNGWVAMGNTSVSTNANTGIPDTGGPPNMIAAFWCDLDPVAAGGGKIYRYYDATGHRFIIEWSGVEHYSDAGTGLPETFQIILLDPAYHATPTGDGNVIVQYALVNDASICTAGIENAAQTIGIQYLYTSELNPAATGLTAGRAIRFTTLGPSSASVDHGAPRPQTVMLQARPNPARGGTHIHFDLLASGPVALRIFGPDGALIRTLVDGPLPAGPGMVEWDGCSDRGQAVPSGVYFYQLKGPGFDVSRKIVKQD
jgi:hypothetical protein